MPDFRDLKKLPKWIWVIGFLGVLFMLFGSFSSPSLDKPISRAPTSTVNTSSTEAAGGDSLQSYKQTSEKQIESILNQIPGVIGAKVMITYDSTTDVIYAQNTQTTNQTTNESDKTGVKRTVTQSSSNSQVVMSNQNGTQAPVIEKKVLPKIRGVLVVAKGAESIRIQEEITVSIQRALDVESFKISVLPEK